MKRRRRFRIILKADYKVKAQPLHSISQGCQEQGKPQQRWKSFSTCKKEREQKLKERRNSLKNDSSSLSSME
jgi:hypothetical protein